MSARAGFRRALLIPRGDGVELVRHEKIIERDQAVGRVASIAADIANWKNFCRHLHGKLIVIRRPDTAAHDQGGGTYAAESGDHVGAPPQEWKRHGNET